MTAVYRPPKADPDVVTMRIREAAERGPDRVVVNDAGHAVPPAEALAVHGVGDVDVVFVRRDGWTLGAPAGLADVARDLWRGEWVCELGRDELAKFRSKAPEPASDWRTMPLTRAEVERRVHVGWSKGRGSAFVDGQERWGCKKTKPVPVWQMPGRDDVRVESLGAGAVVNIKTGPTVEVERFDDLGEALLRATIGADAGPEEQVVPDGAALRPCLEGWLERLGWRWENDGDGGDLIRPVVGDPDEILARILRSGPEWGWTYWPASESRHLSPEYEGEGVGALHKAWMLAASYALLERFIKELLGWDVDWWASPSKLTVSTWNPRAPDEKVEVFAIDHFDKLKSHRLRVLIDPHEEPSLCVWSASMIEPWHEALAAGVDHAMKTADRFGLVPGEPRAGQRSGKPEPDLEGVDLDLLEATRRELEGF